MTDLETISPVVNRVGLGKISRSKQGVHWDFYIFADKATGLQTAN